MKWKDIVKLSERIKENVEKEQSIGYAYEKVSILLATAVKNTGKDIEQKITGKAPEPAGNGIEKNLTKTEYLQVATDVLNFVKSHSRIPNYVIYQKYHISPRLWIYCFAKIIVYYDEHSNTLPLTCWFKNSVFNSNNFSSKTTSKSTSTTTSSCKNPYKNKGHATEPCCEGIGQNNGYFCACHSAQEVIRKLTGKVISQSTLASVMSTTTSGTSHNGIRAGIAWFNKKYGYNLQIEEKSFSDLGWEKIGKLICKSNVDIIFHNLYRNQWGHYEVINEVNTATKMLKVQNSLGSRCGRGCYYGYVEDRSFRTMESYMSGISQKSLLIITRK